MGLSNPVEGARQFAERTFHSLAGLPGSYATRLRSEYKNLKTFGTRFTLIGLFLGGSPIPTVTTPFNSVPESLGSRNSITSTTNESTDSSFLSRDLKISRDLKTGTAEINAQEIPPPAPGKINPTPEYPINTTILIPPLLVSNEDTQPEVNEQEANPPEEPTETEEPIKLDVPPPAEGQVNPSNALDQLGPDRAAVLSLTESNVPANPAGGETTPDPWEAIRGFKMHDETPGGTLSIDNFPGDVPQGQVGYRIRPEAAAAVDEFINGLTIPDPSGTLNELGEVREIKIEGVKVVMRPNLQLKSGIGTADVAPCDACTKTSERYAIIGGTVDPADSKVLIIEFNFFRPDYKLESAEYRQRMAVRNAGTIVIQLSRVLYGVEFNSGKLSQEQRNHIARLAEKFQTIRPLELAAPIAA